MTDVAKRAMKTNNDKVSWFSVIQSVLSQESEDLVQAEDDWEEVELEQDPLELWRLVERTHLTRVTGSTVLDQDNAMTEYNKVRQYDRNESIQEYKKRHERAVDALVRVGHPQVPDVQMQVIKWIRGLNKKHREWKLKILNAMQAGEDPPESLEDAVRLCRNYVPVNDHRDDGGLDGVPSTVFAALAAQKDKHEKDQGADNDQQERKIALKAAGKAGKRGDARATGGKKKKNVDFDDEEDPASEKGQGRVSCWTCGQAGHTTATCQLKDRIYDLVKEGKLFHVRVCLHDSNGKPLLGPYDVLLDDEANVSVFWNRELLSNIRQGGMFQIEGIGPQPISSNLVGDTVDFGTVKFMPDARANILCFDDVADQYKIVWDQPNREFRVLTRSGVYTFGRREKLYVCDLSLPPEPIREEDVVFLSTVTDR